MSLKNWQRAYRTMHFSRHTNLTFSFTQWQAYIHSSVPPLRSVEIQCVEVWKNERSARSQAWRCDHIKQFRLHKRVHGDHEGIAQNTTVLKEKKMYILYLLNLNLQTFTFFYFITLICFYNVNSQVSSMHWR